MPDNMDYLTRAEHGEFAARIDAENKRQNNRLEVLENDVRQLASINANIEKMTLNLQQLTKELTKQGERLEKLEQLPVQKWDKLVSGIIGAIAATIGGGLILAVANGLMPA